MVIEGVPRVFIDSVLAAATLLAALEVTAARGSASALKADTPWTSPLQEAPDLIPHRLDRWTFS